MVLKDLGNNLSNLRKLLRLASVDWRPFLFSSALIIFSSLFEGLSMGLLIPLFDIVVRGGDPKSALSSPTLIWLVNFLPRLSFRYVFLALLGIVLLTVTLKNLTTFFGELFISHISRKVEHALRVKIYERYLTFSKSFFDRTKIGNMADLATGQVLLGCEIFTRAHTLFLCLIFMGVYFSMMVWISWRLALTSLLLLPCIAFVLRFFSRKIDLSAKHRFEADQKIGGYLIDSLTNINLIRSYSNEAAEVSTYAQISNQSRFNLYSISKKICFVSHFLDVSMTAAIGLLLSVSLFIFTKEKTVGISMFMVFFVILRRFTSSFSQLGESVASMSKYFACIDKVLWVFDDQDKEFIKNGQEPFVALKDQIRFENITFGYEDKPILKNVSAEFKKGKMTAIVGPTGSGKSTVASLIPRFYDITHGRLLIDGLEVEKYEVKSLRSKIAFVDQQTPVLNASLRVNITYGCKEQVTIEELDDAAKSALLFDLVRSLPAGYETQLGDRGLRLSGGEKQRLAIARAILKKPEIYIFDEATSALDTETEIQIQKAIESLTKDKTVITIAHRLSTIRNADHIIVLEDGKVSEKGSFEELIKREGRFYHYWKLNKFD